MNYLWLDAETTGLDSNRNDIIQLACIPIIGDKRQKSFNEFCQPTNWDAIDPGATRVHGITESRMRTFQEQSIMLDKLIIYLRSFGIKFVIAGFNVAFDKGFISSTFIKHGKSKEFFELFTLDIHDTFKRAKLVKSQISTPNLKLETLANHYGIKINAHDALSDIAATIEVDDKIGTLLGETIYTEEQEQEIEIKISRKFKEPAQLHVHSMYGMVDSIPSPKEWEKWCDDNDVPAFSIVDHGNVIALNGALKVGKAIPGAGLYIKFKDEGFFALNAWASTEKGYYNLMKLSSLAHHDTVMDRGRSTPLNTLEQLLEYSEGLLFGAPGVDGPVGKYLLDGKFDKAGDIFRELNMFLGERLWWEFTPVDISHEFVANAGFKRVSYEGGNSQKYYNKFLSTLIDKSGGKFIPTSGAHFINPDDKSIQDCISKTSRKDGGYYHQSYHVLKADEMYRGLKRHLGDWLSEERYESMIEETLYIAGLTKDIEIKKDFHLPKIDIPQHLKDKTDDYDMQIYYFMMERIKEHGRWKDDPIYVERFKREVDVIMKNEALNFIPYFLVYEDISTYARSIGILQNIARGSAGGSLMSYYLKIIHVDPIKAELPFERFLSHARIRSGSFPDIDMDIGDTARPDVMKYLQKKYGLGFAQICTFSKMKTKNAIKDVMHALYGKNRNDPEVRDVCDTIPDSPQGVREKDFLYGFTDKEGEYHPGQMDTNQHLKNFFEIHPQVEKMVAGMIGLIRGWSRHASAFVIATVDLASERVPTLVMDDANLGKILVTQYDAGMCEESGLVKADILGLKTLGAVSECLDRIKKSTGFDYLEEDENGMALIYRLPEDEGVYNDFYNKDTDSSFQFNTSLIKGYVQEFVPTKRKHLADMTALCRPGTLDAEWEPGVSAAQYYMDVRNGKTKMSFIHEDLRPILGSSNGVFVYQEEVMQFLVEMGGYTAEESDQIRNAIAKKKEEVMLASFDKIRVETKKRGWTGEQTEKVCNHILAFSRYSFNKSHSYAYAELGYITMYLKHHHKLEWWASTLSAEKNEEKMRKYVAYLGNAIAPPSMKNPSDNFEIHGDKITAPISVVKGVGPNTVKELVSKGPFVDLDDFNKKVNHTKVNIGHVGHMIKSRAADSFMDLSLPYPEARRHFMEEYKRIRKTRSDFKEELLSSDPIELFIMERDSNECFNRHLLSDVAILDIIKKAWPGLKETGRKGIPLTMGGVPILNDLRVAAGLVKKEWEQEVGMIMLYEGSNTKSGESKKTGKPWALTSVSLSDGYNLVEAVKWDQTKAFRWPVNSIIYVRGKLKEGWRDPVSMTIKEIEKVDKT